MYDANYVKEYPEIVPRCKKCGGIIKPDVVLYGEPLDELTVTKALVKIQEADLLLVCGTSLVVYPAASFIDYFRGRNLVLVNKDQNAFDNRANYVIHQKVGELFKGLHV